MDENKKEQKVNNNFLTIIIVAVIFAVGGFFGGMKFQKSKTPSFNFNQFRNGERPSGMPTRDGMTNQSFRPVSGEIVSIDQNTMTVKDQDGNSKIIIISDSTNINKTEEGAKDDLQEGTQVMVIGTEGSDGTVTAQNISIGGNYFRSNSN